MRSEAKLATDVGGAMPNHTPVTPAIARPPTAGQPPTMSRNPAQNENLGAGSTARAMVATYQANATKDDISGTPSFIIDGQKYSNMSYEDFAKILDEKLAN